MRDYEDKCARKGYDETDSSEEEVVLFGQAQDKASLEDEASNEVSNEVEETSINTSSFWGGRVNKQQSSLDSFVRRRTKR
jgi:hypothetical protein